MKKLDIYDPAMCCTTGVCGPSIDPELMRISTSINRLKAQGVFIKRHGLSSEPQDFISNPIISALLESEGPDVLPITLLEGAVIKTKAYPTDDELSKWLEVKVQQVEVLMPTSGCGPEGCC